MSFIKVGTSPDGPFAALPEAAYKGISWGMQDVDFDSGRNADGNMHRNRVARKRKITVTWPPMAPRDVATVLNALAPEEFYVQAFDFEKGSEQVIRMYAGDRTIPYLSSDLGLCDSFSVGLVEY